MPPYTKSDGHASLVLPLGTMLLALVLIIGMLGGSFHDSSLAQNNPNQQARNYLTQTAEQAAINTRAAQTVAALTAVQDTYLVQTEEAQTAAAQTAGAEQAPTDTDAPAEDDDDGGGNGGGNAPAPRSTPTASNTPQPSEAPTPSNTRTPTTEPVTSTPAETPTETGTPTETPQSNFFVCFQNDVTVIEGIGPRNTELVVYFGERPVGGGLSDENGEYAISMVVGSERPGNYLVQVKTRVRRQIVREVICEVPTPTPGLQP